MRPYIPPNAPPIRVTEVGIPTPFYILLLGVVLLVTLVVPLKSGDCKFGPGLDC
jgi:hypothetical protein